MTISIIVVILLVGTRTAAYITLSLFRLNAKIESCSEDQMESTPTEKESKLAYVVRPLYLLILPQLYDKKIDFYSCLLCISNT